MNIAQPDSVLRVDLFGGFRVSLNQQPVNGFVSNKAKAMFAYLFVTRKPQPRQVLAEMFWGDKPDEVANASLRVALSNLRAVAGSHLQIGRHQVGIDAAAPYALDVERFQAVVERLAPRRAFDVQLVEEAVALYRGDLLEGLVVRDALSFEEWALWQRERLRQLALQALHRLSTHHTERGSYEAALQATRRLLELEPWQEEGHRQMMLLLALTGNRNAALAQYETCRRILSTELNTLPLPETNALLERIKSAPQAAAQPRPKSTLFGRQDEYAWLFKQWRQVKPEHGRLTLVEGEMGIGKTRLVEEVLQQVSASDALLLRARCHEFGQNVPLQPIADLLRVALGKQGDLLKRIPPVWLPHLAMILPEVAAAQAARSMDSPSYAHNLNVLHLFEAVHQAFRALVTAATPTSSPRLVIFLDDLHWIDSTTVDLMRYVLHQLAHLPVWLVGAYQQAGMDPEHPFLRLRSALIVEDRASVLRLEPLPSDAIVDWISSLPNLNLPESERGRLIELILLRGQGNPFITSQILRDLADAGNGLNGSGDRAYETMASAPNGSSPSVRNGFDAFRPDSQPAKPGAHPLSDGSQWPLHVARIPFAVREIVLLKLNRLTPAARHLLSEAAAIGEQFDHEALSWMEQDQPVAGLLTECLENGLITASRPGVYTFAHPMMREIAAEWLTPWHRQRVGSRLTRMDAPPAGLPSRQESLFTELA